MFYILEHNEPMTTAEGKRLTYESIDEAEYTLSYFDDYDSDAYTIVSIVDYALNRRATA